MLVFFFFLENYLNWQNCKNRIHYYQWSHTYIITFNDICIHVQHLIWRGLWLNACCDETQYILVRKDCKIELLLKNVTSDLII